MDGDDTETISGYPTRESKGIKTFDIKAFVDEHRTEDPSGFNPFGGGAFVPPLDFLIWIKEWMGILTLLILMN